MTGAHVSLEEYPRKARAETTPGDRRYGKRWQWRGIDNQQILRSGAPQEVGLEVALTLRIFRACKESVVAPCHNIQANTPVENIPAMYEAVQEFG